MLVRSMLNSAKLPRPIRENLWAEAAQYATELENYIVTQYKSKTSYEQFYNKELKNTKLLKPFGEMAIIEINKTRKIRGKLEDRGKPCLYIGKPQNHSYEVGKFF